MNNEPTPPLLISPEQFEQDSTRWMRMITQGDLAQAPLNESFAAMDGNRLQYFSMPPDWVQWLISTVGCTQVKVRFLLNENSRFNLTFYATDAQNSRVSAYYLLNLSTTALGSQVANLSGQTPSASNSVATGGAEGTAGVQIPHGVAGHWVKNWQEADKLTPAMFVTKYGFLQGYNFERDDLMDNLFNDNPQEQQLLRVDFGLHEYYAPSDNDNPQPTHTFGLVLRLVNPDASTSDNPFFDMSTPVPPMY